MLILGVCMHVCVCLVNIIFRACGFDMALLVGRLVFSVGEVALVGFTAKVR